MWKCRVLPQFLPKLFGGTSSGDAYQVDLLSDTLKVAILKDTYSPSLGDEFYDDISGDEITDTGYTAGGPTIGTKTITYTSGSNSFVFNALDTYASADVDNNEARYGIIYKDTGTPATSPLIAIIDFGSVINDPNTNGSEQYGFQWNNVVNAIISGVTWAPGMVSWYGKAILNAFGGETAGEDKRTDWLSDTIKCALLSSSYTPDLDSHETYSDLTDEVSGTNYTSGGETLASKVIGFSGEKLTLSCNGPLWSNVSVSNVRWGAIYNDTNSDKPLLLLLDLRGTYSPSAEDFAIGIPTTGLATLSVAVI